MGLFESIADRRIREARAAGYFDDLPGAGKPIADLATERPAGWWGARVVKTERDKLRFDELRTEVAAAMVPLWRAADEDEIGERVAAINLAIETYNASTSFERHQPLHLPAVTARWRQLRAATAATGR